MTTASLATLSVVALVGCGGDPSTAGSTLPIRNQTCLDAARSSPASPTVPESPAGPDGAPIATVDSKVVEGLRVSGEKRLAPDDDTKWEVSRAKVSTTSAAFKFCLDTAGVPVAVQMFSSSCFPRYDAQIDELIRTWRFSPYVVDGVAVPVCTVVVFIYSQK